MSNVRPHMDDERTTKELIEVLGNDCDRCHAQLIEAIDSGDVDEDGAVDADYEFHARQLIRAIFAYIEAVTFSMKATSAWKCMEDGTEITPQERYFATDTEYEVNERGEIVESVAKLSLARNIRFAFVMHRKAHRDSAPFDASVEWWSCLKEAIRIRDRLTHPKMPNDLDVSGEEVVKVLKAKKAFEEEALRYAPRDAA
jgi:hypothetical protein